MVGDAFQHLGLADAAIAALAVKDQIHAACLQHLDDGLVGGDGEDLAGRGDLNLERFVAGLVRGVFEQLGMEQIGAATSSGPPSRSS